MTERASGDDRIQDAGQKALGFHAFQQDRKRSALTKYQDLFVGNRSLWELLKFELLTLALMNRPGMLGFFLRQRLYPFIFKQQGKGVAIASGVALRQPARISLGDGCVIDELARMSVQGSEGAGIRLGRGVLVGRGSIINTRDAIVDIADNTTIGSYCRISTRAHLSIGRYGMIAAFCYIGGGNHGSDRTDIPMALQEPENRGGVTIGEDVWVGAHTTIVDGVTIGKGSIVGAMSFVNKDLPDFSIAFGCPAKVHKKRMPPENE